MAAMYCTNTKEAEELRDKGCENMVLNIRQPGGESQIFEPRPRAESWCVAVRVVPGGREAVSVGFLDTQVSVLVEGDVCVEERGSSEGKWGRQNEEK